MVVLNRSRTRIIKKVDIDIWNFCLFRPFKINNALRKLYRERFLITSKETNKLFDNLFMKADRKLRRIFLKKKSYFGRLLVLKRRLYIFFGFMTPHKIRNFFLDIFFYAKPYSFINNLVYVIESILLFFVIRLHFFFSYLDSIRHIKHNIFRIDGECCSNPFYKLPIGSLFSVISEYWRSFFFRRIYIYWYNEYVRSGSLMESCYSLLNIRYFLFNTRFFVNNKRGLLTNFFSQNKYLVNTNKFFFLFNIQTKFFHLDNRIFSNGLLESFMNPYFRDKVPLFFPKSNIFNFFGQFSNSFNFNIYFLIIKLYYSFLGLSGVLLFFFRKIILSYRRYLKVMSKKIVNSILYFKFFLSYLIKIKQQISVNSKLLFFFLKKTRDREDGNYQIDFKFRNDFLVLYELFIRFSSFKKIFLIDENINSQIFFQLLRLSKRLNWSFISNFWKIKVISKCVKFLDFFTHIFISNISVYLKKRKSIVVNFFSFIFNFWYLRQYSSTFSLWSSDMILKLNGLNDFYRSSLKKKRNIRYLKNKLYDDFLWKDSIDLRHKGFSVKSIQNRLQRVEKRKKQMLSNNFDKKYFSTKSMTNSQKYIKKNKYSSINTNNNKKKSPHVVHLVGQKLYMAILLKAHKKIASKKFREISNKILVRRRGDEVITIDDLLNRSLIAGSMPTYVVILFELLILAFYDKNNESESIKLDMLAYYKQNVLLCR